VGISVVYRTERFDPEGFTALKGSGGSEKPRSLDQDWNNGFPAAMAPETGSNQDWVSEPEMDRVLVLDQREAEEADRER
jgi:hypothetical protein